MKRSGRFWSASNLCNRVKIFAFKLLAELADMDLTTQNVKFMLCHGWELLMLTLSLSGTIS